jgi:hypothetical protein
LCSGGSIATRALPELAEALGSDLSMSGAPADSSHARLVRWHHVGRRKKTRLAITPARLATMRALLRAAGQTAEVADTPKEAIR